MLDLTLEVLETRLRPHFRSEASVDMHASSAMMLLQLLLVLFQERTRDRAFLAFYRLDQDTVPLLRYTCTENRITCHFEEHGAHESAVSTDRND